MADLLPSLPDVSGPDSDEPRVVGVDSDAADDLLSALSSRTARRMLSELHEEPASPSALADRVDTSLQNAQYHLGNLVDAGLVEVAGTAYSEKGREMNVYAPADRALVVVAGREEDTSGLKATLARLLGGVGVLGGASLVVDRLVSSPTIGGPGAAPDSGGGDAGAADGGDGADAGDADAPPADHGTPTESDGDDATAERHEDDAADDGATTEESADADVMEADDTPTPEAADEEAATPTGDSADTPAPTEESADAATETATAAGDGTTETATAAGNGTTETATAAGNGTTETATAVSDSANATAGNATVTPTPTPEGPVAEVLASDPSAPIELLAASPGLLFFLGGLTAMLLLVLLARP